MYKLSKEIKSWIIVWITFFIIMLFWWMVYASISHVVGWNVLTATKFNQVIDSVVPSGNVSAFNLSSCPTWWSPADWSSGLDLRWEFIRWLDNGRWVDAGRTLWTFQSGTQLPWIAIWSSNPTIGRTDQPINTWNMITDYEWESYVTSSYRRVPTTTYTSTCCNWTQKSSVRVRPRNVALLYCIKN